jgi:2-enoate reductase
LEGSIPSFKKDTARLLEWYRRELEILNVDIKLGTEATPDLVASKGQEVVILATGSNAIVPDVPGIQKDKVATAIDLLLGQKHSGEKVLVLGGGLIGCETALWLAQQGKKVTVAEILPELLIAGIPVQHMNRLMLLNLLKFYNVQAILNSSLLEVTDQGVILIDKDFQRKPLQVDTVILAVGLKSDRTLYQALRTQVPDLYLIGDSRRAQNVMNAIWDAYEVARAI